MGAIYADTDFVFDLLKDTGGNSVGCIDFTLMPEGYIRKNLL